MITHKHSLKQEYVHRDYALRSAVLKPTHEQMPHHIIIWKLYVCDESLLSCNCLLLLTLP
jgi:hypothetical protein